MDEDKFYYVCCFIEGNTKTIEMPPMKGPYTYEEAEKVRKKYNSGRYHKKLKYRILDTKNGKVVN